MSSAVRRRRAFGALLVLIAAVAVLYGVQHARASKPRPLVKATPIHYSVGLARCTFFDPSRSTPNYPTGTSAKGRTLITEIRYPTLASTGGLSESPGANPARRHGPFPLVVFGSGYALDPSAYSELLDYWVRAGFVVASPLYPDTNQAAVGRLSSPDAFLAEADDTNQPADDAFVTRALLRSSRESGGCSLVHGLLNPAKLALAGQSDGATTAIALAFDPKYASPGLRFRAVVDLSGELFGAGTVAPDRLTLTSTSPALFVSQSATDTCNPPQFSTAVYNGLAGSNKWFLKINRADHLPPYVGSDRAVFGVVAKTTTEFLAAEIDGRGPGRSIIRSGNSLPNLATLIHGGSAPALAPLALSGTTCYLRS